MARSLSAFLKQSFCSNINLAQKNVIFAGDSSLGVTINNKVAKKLGLLRTYDNNTVIQIFDFANEGLEF